MIERRVDEMIRQIGAQLASAPSDEQEGWNEILQAAFTLQRVRRATNLDIQIAPADMSDVVTMVVERSLIKHPIRRVRESYEEHQKTIEEQLKTLIGERSVSDMDELSLASLLPGIRTVTGMGQSELARNMGCSASSLSRIENGKRPLTLPKAVDFFIGLGIDPKQSKFAQEVLNQVAQLRRLPTRRSS